MTTGRHQLHFPDGFRWGTSTSAYQVEGSVRADGKGESIWDRFCAVPGAIENGDTGEAACDQYERWPDDVALMAEMGLNAHRFSLAWPRIVPAGSGRVEQRGLDHYDRLLDALLERGIAPLVTLYHWDLPQPLQDAGGWRNRETAERFAEYAAVCFDAFGDRVRDWVTINEPWVVGLLGHQLGLHAPGEKDLRASAEAMHHLLLAHGLAVRSLRAAGAAVRTDARAGVAYSLWPHTPATDSAADREAAHGSDGYTNRWFLDPVHGRGYPADMRAHWERAIGPLDFVRDGDEDTIAAGSDFIGVNYYTRRIVRAGAGDGPWPWKVEGGRADVPRTDLNWEILPGELESLLVRLHEEYPGVPLMVTENGGVFNERPGGDGAVRDARRVDFLHRHLAAVHGALAAGAPVEGYYHWSFIDNFEWAMGYRPQFGLVHVDRETQRRTVKDSGLWYGEAARGGAIPAVPEEALGSGPEGA